MLVQSVVSPQLFCLALVTPMAKTRQKKEQALAEVTALLKDARGVVFADYGGLTVKDMQELRRSLRQNGVGYEVVKKTLLSRALKAVGLTAVDTAVLQGMVSLATSATDEVEPAKQLVDFAKTHENLKVMGGVLEAAFVDRTKVMALAKLPGKQQLLGQLVGTLAAPLSGFVNVLQGNLRGLVQVLRAAAEKSKA